MTTLATVLRGLRSRALLSVTTLVMMVVVLGGVVLGPVFQQASVDSYTLTRVDTVPEPLTALSWSAVVGRQDAASGSSLAGLAESAVTEVERIRPETYASPEVLLFTGEVTRPSDGAAVRYLARDDVCSTLEVEGRCPERPGEVLVNRDDLRDSGIGDVVEAPLLGDLEIVGVYRTPDTTDDWLFPATLASRPPTPAPNVQPYRPAPYVVAPEAVARLRPGLWDVRLESRLVVPERLSDEEFDDLVADVQELRDAGFPIDGGQLFGTSVVNALGSVLVDVRGQRDAARTALAPAVVSLVLVGLAMILRLQVASVGLRDPEQALAALRGLSRRRAWVLGLSEPWLLVLASVPLGLLAGYAAASAMARAWLRPGLVLEVPTASVVGVAAVTAALAGVTAVAVAQGMKETIGTRLAGAHRPGPSSRTVITAELVVVLAALVLPLTRVGTDPGGLAVVDLLLPVSVAVAAGLLTTRLVTLVATSWSHRGAQRPLSVFVAARAVARRSQGTLVILPVTAAISLAVFAVGVDSVAAAWRGSVAATTAPAGDVYDSPLTLDETLQLSRDVDPEGRYAMAVGRVTVPSEGTVVAVDSSRLGRVGAWPAQWLGRGRTGAQAAELVRPPAPVQRIAGDQVSLTVDSPAPGATVILGVRTIVGDQTLRFGPFPEGSATLTDDGGACAPGCLLRSISVDGSDAPVSVTGVAVDDEPVPGVLTDGGWTAAPEAGLPPAWAVDDPGTVRVPAGDPVLPAAATVRLPVLVGKDADRMLGDGGTTLETSSEVLDVRVAEDAESLPYVGPAGVLVDLPSFLLRSDPPPPLVLSSVLVRDDAPDDVVDGLLGAGLVRVGGVEDERGSLDDSAYAQALRLYLVVGGVLLLMALGGLLVSISVQMPARRRDAASLRVVGVPRRTVVLSSVWESVVVLGAAALAGVLAGVAALWVLLPSLDLGVTDDATIPRVLPEPDPTRLALLVVLVVVVLLAVATVTSVVTVRRARGASLRETAR